MVQHIRIVLRYDNGGVPVPAQLTVQFAYEAFAFPGLHVQAGNGAKLAFIVEVAVGRPVGYIVHAITSACTLPMLHANGLTGSGSGGAAHRAIILKPAIYVVRVGHICLHGIALRQRLFIGVVPVFAPVISNAHAVVIAQNYMFGVSRVYPKGMIITAKGERAVPTFAPVGSFPNADAEYISMVFIVGVCSHLLVVISGVAPHVFTLGANLFPANTPIAGAPHFGARYLLIGLGRNADF